MAGHSYHDPNYDPGIFNVYFTQDPSTGICTNIAITCKFGTAGVLNCYSRSQIFRCELQLRFAGAGDVVSIGSNWPNPQPDGNGSGPDNSGDHYVNLGNWTYTPHPWELQNGQLKIDAWANSIDDTGTRSAGNCSGYISVTHHFTPPDNTPPTISFTEPSGGTFPTDSGGSTVSLFKELTDTSATIGVSISDSESGPKQFQYRINEYEFDGSSLIGPTSGSWQTGGISETISLSDENIYEVEVKEAEDNNANKTSGTEKSNKFLITSTEATTDKPPTPATITPGCKDYWATGFPQNGIVTLDDLKTSPKVINKIKEVYGMTDAEVEELWTWHTDMFDLPASDPMHSSIASAEMSAASTKTPARAFASPVGALTGRSGGWFNGLYGRGHNGSSSYTATWLGRRSTGAPQPVLEHLSVYGEFWGYSPYGGWNTGIGGIRGRGTDRNGNVNVNMHRKRDEFIMKAVAAWASGSTFPTSSHASAAAYSGQPCGIDMFLAGLDIVPQGGGNFKIDDCIAPTIDEVRVKSATVVAGNGKEYYVDYPNTDHVCWFEVEATDMEYGLKEAIFTAVIDSVDQAPSAPVPFTGTPQGTAIVEYDVDTQGHLEVYVDVEVFDMADNSTTETMSAKVISIDDGEPQGGLVSGSGQTNATNSTTTPGLKLHSPDYMVGTKPYYNSKNVDFFIEYEDEYSGIDEAKLYINGNVELQTPTLPQLPTATPHAQVHNVSGGNLREGINNAQLWLKDLATNEWFSNTLDFYIDETKPVCFIDFSTQDTILQNGGKYWTKENSINVDLTYDDVGPDPSGVDQGLIVVNGSAPTSVSDFSLSLSGTSKTGHTVSSLTVGQNDIDFYTIDKTENISNKNTITVWVDQTVTTGSMVRAEPIATLTDANEYTNTNKFDVTLTKSDSDSGFF